jgi:hypothetical protein
VLLTLRGLGGIRVASMNRQATLEAIVNNIIRAWDKGDLTTVEEHITAVEEIVTGESRVVVLGD